MAGQTGALAAATAPWLVVGLGNPGPAYAGNRHNVGAMVVREMARRSGVSLRSGKTRSGRALVADVRLGAPVAGPPGAAGPRLVLAQPLSFMNECGAAVSGLSSFYKVPVDRLVVVHDDLDIPSGEVRLKRGGGEGGHNGLRSVTSRVGTRDYLRVRAGIGRPPGRMDPADYVLRDFPASQREETALLVDSAADAVELLVGSGLLAAQQRYHAP